VFSLGFPFRVQIWMRSHFGVDGIDTRDGVERRGRTYLFIHKSGDRFVYIYICVCVCGVKKKASSFRYFPLSFVWVLSIIYSLSTLLTFYTILYLFMFFFHISI
jgi:hypothetical protein